MYTCELKQTVHLAQSTLLPNLCHTYLRHRIDFIWFVNLKDFKAENPPVTVILFIIIAWSTFIFTPSFGFLWFIFTYKHIYHLRSLASQSTTNTTFFTPKVCAIWKDPEKNWQSNKKLTNWTCCHATMEPLPSDKVRWFTLSKTSTEVDCSSLTLFSLSWSCHLQLLLSCRIHHHHPLIHRFCHPQLSPHSPPPSLPWYVSSGVFYCSVCEHATNSSANYLFCVVQFSEL